MKTSLKLLTFLIISSLFVMSYSQIFAQEKELVRPKNIGNSEFDNFKNSSFDIYSNLKKYSLSLDAIEKNITSYTADVANINNESLNKDKKSLLDIKNSITKLEPELKGLDEEGKALIEKAKTLSPKTKSVQAVKSTAKSVKALDQSKDLIKSEGARVEEYTKKLAGFAK